MAIDPLNKLCKWRMVLAGWIFGSHTIDQPAVQGMRDLMDKWLIMRAENNAILGLLIEKNVINAAEFQRRLNKEADWLDRDMERRFPGMRSTENGVVFYDLDMANKTMSDLGFPP
jgi:hypothetical protein